MKSSLRVNFNQKILIFGHKGLIGSALLNELKKQPDLIVIAVNSNGINWAADQILNTSINVSFKLFIVTINQSY